jgi:hypothetical protein
MVVARTLLMFIGIGFGAGWLMLFIRVPYIDCIIWFFLGLLIGRGMAKVLDDKLGLNVTKIIVFGLLIGMSLSPLALLPFFMFSALQASFMGEGTIFGALTAIVSSIFTPGCFILGILRATVWGERWY